jgi:hypothetical protein
LQVEPGKPEQQQQEQTIDTKVFKLFEEGETPVQVAITLNHPSTEVTRLHREYWKLIGLQELDRLYEEAGDDIFQFHRTYELIKKEGYTPQQLIDAADHLDELPLLRSEREQLTQEIQNLVDQKDQLNESMGFARMDLNSINLGIDVHKKELERLNYEKRQYESLIASMNSSTGCQRIRSIAEGAARDILTDNMVVLGAALHALLQALSEEPRNELQLVIYGSLRYPLYQPSNGSPPQNYIQLRQEVLLKSAEEMYQDLLAKAVNNTMSSITDDQPSFSPPWRGNQFRQ